jgi:hypothetical protein
VDNSPNLVDNFPAVNIRSAAAGNTVRQPETNRDSTPYVGSGQGRSPTTAAEAPNLLRGPLDPTSSLSERLLFRGYGLLDLERER